MTGAKKPRLTTLKPRLQEAPSRIATVSGTSWRAGKQTAAQRGYGAKWQRERLRYLAEHPLCVLCQAKGEHRIAEVVDHIIPHRGDQGLFWDRKNWQAVCKPHHDSEAQRKDQAYPTEGTGL